MEKICKKCLITKPLSEFYVYSVGHGGRFGKCKECVKEGVRANYKDKIEQYHTYDKQRQHLDIKRIIDHRYSQMKKRTTTVCDRQYGAYGKPILSKEEYIAWFNQNRKDFNALYKEWADANFIKRLSPSIDRIDNSIGYIASNMQWLSFSDNAAKGNK